MQTASPPSIYQPGQHILPPQRSGGLRIDLQRAPITLTFISRPAETTLVRDDWHTGQQERKRRCAASACPGISAGSHFTCRCVTPEPFSGKVRFNLQEGGAPGGKAGIGGGMGKKTGSSKFRRLCQSAPPLSPNTNVRS